jgi:4-amino-4-deoxy-L-arabinose transferase-like glycosyltransferase
MTPTYPIGLPLHLAALAPIVGWEKTARVVNACNVLAAGALLYVLGRRLGLGRGWALAGVAALWLSPLWILFALQPMSDPVAVTWTLAAIYCAWRSRERWWWALLAGAAIGVDVLVRPANLVVAVPVLIAFGLNWRAWLVCGLGGVPFAAAMLLYNMRAYGGALTTGYGFVGDAFELKIVPHNFAHFALWVPLLVGAPIGLAALTLPWTRVREATADKRVPWLLGAWFASFAAFYLAYWFAGETWWYVRFLLPAFPAVILAGLLVLQRLAIRGRRARGVALALVVVGFVSQRVLAHELLTFSVRDGERRYYRVCQWLNENLPANAIVASCQLSGAQYYYTPFPLLRWDQLPGDEMERIIPGLRAANRPLYAVVFKFEEERAMKEHLPGRWTKLHEIEDDVAVWRFEPTR